MSPEQIAAARRAQAALTQLLAGATTTPAPDAEPTLGSALRAGAAIADALPNVDLNISADGAHLRVRVYGFGQTAEQRVNDAVQVAAFLTIADIEIRPPRDEDFQVWIIGALAGCLGAKITLFLPSGDAPRVAELLAPLRALVPAEPAEDPDADIRRLAELSAAGQEHRAGGAV